ncbi:MAG: hypothetical protein ACJ70N_06690, partial [Nitrososphaera sp.]
IYSFEISRDGYCTYIFVFVLVCNNFTCTSLEKNRKSFIALFAEANLGDISTSPKKNGELKACYAATVT